MQSEPAKREVLALVVKVLTGSFPDRFQLRGSVLSNVSTGEEFDIADEARNPLDIVARLLQVIRAMRILADFELSELLLQS